MRQLHASHRIFRSCRRSNQLRCRGYGVQRRFEPPNSAAAHLRAPAPDKLDGVLRWSKCRRGRSPGINDVGVTGGGQVGCNWQWSLLLLGGEADIQYTGIDGSRDVFASDASAHENFRSRWLATFRGRLGYLVVPNMNFYATGGLAVANVDRTSVVTLNGNTSNVSDQQHTQGGR